MTIPALMDEFLAALDAAGASAHRRTRAQFAPADAAALKALESEVGEELTDDLRAWLSHVHCELELKGSYHAISAESIVRGMGDMREIDFSRHHENITRWKDGRFDGGQLANTYWQPQWVPIAQDGCGNEYCVDLAPGPKGKRGQLVAMEFQDGQGPYLARWSSLEDMLRAHLAMLADGHYVVDDEGFIEFD